jgi:hypothetical protein
VSDVTKNTIFDGRGEAWEIPERVPINTAANTLTLSVDKNIAISP